MLNQEEYEAHCKMREEAMSVHDNYKPLAWDDEDVADEVINSFVDEPDEKTRLLEVLDNIFIEGNTVEYQVQDLYRNASPSLQADLEFAKGCIALDGICYEHAPEEVRRNRDLLIAASRTNGWALCAAPEQFKDDEEIVLECTKNKRNNFNHASDRIQDMCRGQDPVKYLESRQLADELKVALSSKAEVKQPKKLKL